MKIILKNFTCFIWLILFCSSNFYFETAVAYWNEEGSSIDKYLKPVEIVEPDSGFESIDCVYVINLDERPERWARIKELCDHNGIKINRFSAINGWKLSQQAKEELSGPYPTRLDGGKLGCLLSHISIFKDACERGYQTIWILEDDEEFLEDVRQISSLLNQLSKLDPLWDNFFTDVNSRNQNGNYVRALAVDPRPDQQLHLLPYYIQRKKITKDIVQIRQRYGTYSIIWSNRGINKALDYFRHVYFWAPIDIDIHYIPGIKEYGCTRDIVSNLLNHDSSDTVPESTLNPDNHQESFSMSDDCLHR